MNVKHDRSRMERCGVPEVVFGEGKSAEELTSIVDEFLTDLGRAVLTRVSPEKAEKVISSIDEKKFDIIHNKTGNVLVVKKKNFAVEPVGRVGLLTAGTSDIPVAEEAAAIAEELGCVVVREYDVGISGIYRVFSALENLKNVSVFIVVAGMEGALPSVVAGLVHAPVIAVPSSIGYGVGEGGKAALYTMLNSCSPLAVVNIDNGYGAAVLAYKILSSKNEV
ncbi:MAG: nickel pincer cofactor biosynthesis protein LarB [Candidatus Altiarchaeota archaeon]|nr:nickel pincer cofactor biosynthesis protein LarB [Candidatus Altiarchaeota archaeon]